MPTRELSVPPSPSRLNGPDPGAPVLRCFIALWPDPAARDQLDTLANRLQQNNAGSRRVAREDLHLTLAFIGALAANRAHRVAAMLEAIAAPHFAWILDRVGGFDRAHVAWAGGTEDPRLAALAQAARVGLDALQVAYDHKPFVAHVTLLRKVAHTPSPEACAPIAWSVSVPVLAVSERDEHGRVRYRPWSERPPGFDTAQR